MRVLACVRPRVGEARKEHVGQRSGTAARARRRSPAARWDRAGTGTPGRGHGDVSLAQFPTARGCSAPARPRLARTRTPAPPSRAPSRTEAGERLRPGPGVTDRTARLNRKAPGADGPTENYSARRSQSGSSGPAAEQVRAFGSSSMQSLYVGVALRLPGRKG